MALTGEPEATEPQTFQSLYRRYRPQRFAEVRGQEHVALALRNAVRDGKVAHAYLFSGPRGTGKTSTARILAKALDCENLQDGEPCGVCASCVSITAGTSYDVHELDAASNNGVEAMRDLVARASLSTPGRWKVYIVDEVHMLSTGASNALLKTLEEPPSHVVFVLATTDPQKVLPTIRSRTQHFEFHLITGEVLGSLLGDIALDAGLELPEGAVASAVRKAKGSARDALSVLDQVAAMGSIDDDSDQIGDVITAIAAYDSAGVLLGLDRAISSGRDPRQLAVDLIDRLRTGFLLQLGAAGLVDGGELLTKDETEEFRALGTARCVRALELIGTAVVAMREAPEPRITLEVSLIRCTHPEADVTPEAMVDRIERIERRLDQSPPVAAINTAGRSAERSSTDRPMDEAPRRAPSKPSSGEGADPREEAALRNSATAGERIDPKETGQQETGQQEAGQQAPGRSATGQGDSGREDSGRQESGQRHTETADQPPQRPQAVTSKPALGAYLRSTPPVDRRSADPVQAANSDSRVFAPLGAEDAATPPSYDELVLAWGDHVLTGLRPKARAIYQAARFVGNENGEALMALPNEAHLLHADPLKQDVAAALTAHFKRPVRIRLVVDSGQLPLRPPVGLPEEAHAEDEPPRSGAPTAPTTDAPRPREASVPPTGDAPNDQETTAERDEEDFSDIGTPLDAHEEAEVKVAGIAWAENRLREAFPGAEEV